MDRVFRIHTISHQAISGPFVNSLRLENPGLSWVIGHYYHEEEKSIDQSGVTGTMRIIVLLLGCILGLPSGVPGQKEIPVASDPRLTVELIAESPEIVHPVSCDFDSQGQLLVIESHTHFAPKDYQGPKFDRIRRFDVNNKQSKPTTFFEGTRHTMDLATHPDGSVYIATRNEILRLRDTRGNGIADEKTRIVFLDTQGDYPHNGLSGLCFDARGNLTFGMGENLGARYTLIGSDGTRIGGEGDGGHIFHCSAEGKNLRKVATGFWNPFGICRDIFGHTFCVDNDPDQAPPCRLVQVVEGGDYGFRFCYGRSGKHPFQSWYGTLPGTLPMMTGVGEAPCEILSYESDGLPKEYQGQLMVTSWADHRVELYPIKPRGASFKSERTPFVQGGANFRPVGLCIAPDGSLIVTDWVLSNYNLHGKGAIWRIRAKEPAKIDRPKDPRLGLRSFHRPLREESARKLAANDPDYLIHQLKDADIRVKAAALEVLSPEQLRQVPLRELAEKDTDIGIREMAVRALRQTRQEVTAFISKDTPAILQTAALPGLSSPALEHEASRLLNAADPFLRQAAIVALVKARRQQCLSDLTSSSPTCRQQLVLVARGIDERTNPSDSSSRIGPKRFLEDPDETVRFLAVKWIADQRLTAYRGEMEKGLLDPTQSVRMIQGFATARARIDGSDVNDKTLADLFASRLLDQKTPPDLRALFLRQVPSGHPQLTVQLLSRLLQSEDPSLQKEALRALAEHPSHQRESPLLEAFRNPKLGTALQALALQGLLDLKVETKLPELMTLMQDRQSPLQADAERALLGVTQKNGQVYRRPTIEGRPSPKDIEGWLKRLEGPADSEAGSRVFFHPRLAGCSKCHRVDGRGADVGPDLSAIGRTERRHLLESILQPSSIVAPHYVAWHLETNDGKVKTGMLLHTNLDDYTYLDARGERFTLKTGNLAEQYPLTTSIMPEGLEKMMTDQELRDLLAYLQSRK